MVYTSTAMVREKDRALIASGTNRDYTYSTENIMVGWVNVGVSNMYLRNLYVSTIMSIC